MYRAALHQRGNHITPVMKDTANNPTLNAAVLAADTCVAPGVGGGVGGVGAGVGVKHAGFTEGALVSFTHAVVSGNWSAYPALTVAPSALKSFSKFIMRERRGQESIGPAAPPRAGSCKRRRLQ